ncbi:hypothetical protein PTSG_00467 [Salpingoeca rosetta]|uniref:Leucine zipper transcription factor-like protein 1 n=1 Tax=Salpingoeca rosetta (strain ATCC 50818 / BSB-021) TaxID=946362 RepID=F2TWK0_SALR5|nr:uncharacterized protein PTSG_00467 [Salpingoeca rosetta]EGD72446.1 hypothetical protein PTSG_00467 [Salpingoeca rosetta]|eukprot:XP_004999015.1 hypothetical protein PTSG_00467 [Salpingoeca rosetta]
MDKLNETHKHVCKDYLAFMRYKRTQHVRDIEATFTDLKESRLQDSTFTREEVEDMVDGLCDVVKGDVETELINSSHTNVLVLRKMMEQGEEWKLTFKLETGTLEDRHALDDIARFERQESASSSLGAPKLEPLKESASPALIKHEMDALRSEVQTARDAQQRADQRAVEVAKENEALKQRIAELEAKAATATATTSTPVPKPPPTSAQPSGNGDKAKQQVQELEKAKDKVETELKSAKAEILSLSAKLREVEAALEAKVHAAPQFVNMRKMLDTKNHQIKELREQLGKQ